MPTILETFQDYEADMLDMIAEQWGIQDDIDLKNNIKKQICNFLKNKALFKEIVQSLPADAHSALMHIFNNGGKTQAAQFMRLYGEIREMGAGTREKERPDRNPISISENLFYKGLIALSFFSEKNEAEEFVYLPQEFNIFLKPIHKIRIKANNPPALTERNHVQIIYGSDEILDHICSLLAAYRGKVPADEVSRVIPYPIQQFLTAFFHSQKIINSKADISDLKILKEFLLGERDAVFSNICILWTKDNSFNELTLLPNLSFEGKWKNNPAKTRRNLLEIISNLDPDNWFSITGFINWMHQTHPDFQRSRGEYDLWFIRNIEADKFINGFENWYLVEGKLLEYFLTGPLFWLGIIDLASDDKSNRPIGFKKSKWADALLGMHSIKYDSIETTECAYHTNGEILVPANTQREIRYQIARFCVWGKKLANHYRYKISSTAIKRAEAQNLNENQIKTLVEKHGKKPVPKNIIVAIDRWKKHQTQVEVKDQIIIHTASAGILDQVQKSTAKQYIIERLNPTTAIISSKNLHRFEDALTKLGYFPEIGQDV